VTERNSHPPATVEHTHKHTQEHTKPFQMSTPRYRTDRKLHFLKDNLMEKHSNSAWYLFQEGATM